MKKLLIMPLLVGAFSVCFAYTGSTTMSNSDVVCIQKATASGILDNVFAAAVNEYQELYGVEMSIEEMWSGYANGTVTVTEVVPGQLWEVSLAGGIIIAIDPDNF